jgi:hypothetical protein
MWILLILIRIPNTACDKTKYTFLSLIRHIFLKTGWSKALPYIFGWVRAREPTYKASIALYGSLDFLKIIPS